MRMKLFRRKESKKFIKVDEEIVKQIIKDVTNYSPSKLSPEELKSPTSQLLTHPMEAIHITPPALQQSKLHSTRLGLDLDDSIATSSKDSNSSITFGSLQHEDLFSNVSMVDGSLDYSTNSQFTYLRTIPRTNVINLNDSQSIVRDKRNALFRSHEKKIDKSPPLSNTKKTSPNTSTRPFPHYMTSPSPIHNATKLVSPNSIQSGATDPCTPESFHEFPKPISNRTPDIHGFTKPPQIIGGNDNYHHHSSSKSCWSNHSTTSKISSSSPSPPYPMNSSFSTTSTSSSKQLERAAQAREAVLAEVEYWKGLMKYSVSVHGPNSLEVVRLMFGLGGALCRSQQHDEALSWYKKIARILRQYPNNRLILSRALDKVGLTASLCTNKQNLQWALIALHESLSIRHSLLGPHHCDVVDTLNNIAGVHLHQGEYIQARDAYIEVLTVRSAIFGKRHPSVAVTAATLGKVYTNLSEFDNALRYMYFALRVYKEEPNSLRDSHPVVQKILRNISRTERLKRR